ncbi:MAG: hypothetical protein KJ047_06090 [Anaerolineae bacterium]|nr:hypothetical protein [Anaerolineae bacterium]MEB2288682.1 hypothetical protein [Anaerolineae bacterium]
MDIQHLVDRLEDLIDEGRHVPFSKFTLIDEERALEIIDQMRISVPEQIEIASRVINQRDRVLAQATEEAERVRQIARDQSKDMVERDAIVKKARSQAQNIVEEAYREAENIRADADSYVVEVLKELEGQLMHNLAVARNGVAKIMEARAASRAQTQVAAEQERQSIALPVEEYAEATLDQDSSRPGPSD